MNKPLFIAWLRSRGFVAVPGKPDTYEKDDVRYRAGMQSLGKRTRISANRWSSEETWRYSRRFVNADGKLDWTK